MAHTDIPNAEKRIGTRDKDVPWYNANLTEGDLDETARKLLIEYSKIPADEVEQHICSVRDKAWQIHPYPCIGQFRFLSLSLPSSPYWKEIVTRLSSPSEERYLDLGCCLGQDIRSLVEAGVSSDRLYGSDIHTSFWDLGYDLFNDRQTLKSTFIQSDIFDPVEALLALEGKISVINIGSFLHLFGLEDQKVIVERITKLLKSEKGVMVVGRQVGDVNAGERIHTTNPRGGKMFRHNEESFVGMWKEVGEKMGVKWKVEVRLLEAGRWDGKKGDDSMSWKGGDGTRRMKFAIIRE